MDDADLLEALTGESRRVLDIEAFSLDRPVPWLGEWTVGEVIAHLASVQRWATALCADPGSTIRRRDMERPPSGDAVLAWYRDGVAPMLDAFDGADLDTIVHTWAGRRPRRWWLRRLAHETAVHRWDAEAAAMGRPAVRPIVPDLAADGIDEMFENFLPLVAGSFGGSGQTMHVHATDAPGEWQLTFAPDDVTVERVHAKGDVAALGPAHALLLVLWNRAELDDAAVEAFGDLAVLELWQRTARF